MRVAPEFFYHYKTQSLIRALNTELAPLYVLKLWAHCQLRKTDKLNFSAEKLAMICGFNGNPLELQDQLIAAGFLDPGEKEELVVHDWLAENAGLVQRWEAGKSGGRPRKPDDNRPVTDRQPGDNPSETGQKPDDNRSETDRNRGQTYRVDRIERSREEKSREEEMGNPPTPFVAAQYKEAELALRVVAGYFNTTIPPSGTVEGELFMDALSRQLPVSAEGLDHLMRFYQLPRDHAIFLDPRHPGRTSRRRSLSAVASNLRAECEKATDAIKNLAAVAAAAERKENMEEPPGWAIEK